MAHLPREPQEQQLRDQDGQHAQADQPVDPHPAQGPAEGGQGEQEDHGRERADEVEVLGQEAAQLHERRGGGHVVLGEGERRLGGQERGQEHDQPHHRGHPGEHRGPHHRRGRSRAVRVAVGVVGGGGRPAVHGLGEGQGPDEEGGRRAGAHGQAAQRPGRRRPGEGGPAPHHHRSTEPQGERPQEVDRGCRRDQEPRVGHHHGHREPDAPDPLAPQQHGQEDGDGDADGERAEVRSHRASDRLEHAHRGLVHRRPGSPAGDVVTVEDRAPGADDRPHVEVGARSHERERDQPQHHQDAGEPPPRPGPDVPPRGALRRRGRGPGPVPGLGLGTRRLGGAGRSGAHPAIIAPTPGDGEPPRPRRVIEPRRGLVADRVRAPGSDVEVEMVAGGGHHLGEERPDDAADLVERHAGRTA